MTNITHDLIEAYEDYIKNLSSEIEELVGIAYAHGWMGSKRYEIGVRLREKINKLKKQATTNEPNY